MQSPVWKMDAGSSLRPAFHKQNLKAQGAYWGGGGRMGGQEEVYGVGVGDEGNAEEHDTKGKGMGEETRGMGDNFLQRKQQV